MELNITTMVNEMAKNIRENAIFSALAFSAIHGLKDDEISELKAFKRYGRAWVTDRLERGQIHFSRVSGNGKSVKFYSVFEIETLKRSEKLIEDMYNNQKLCQQ